MSEDIKMADVFAGTVRIATYDNERVLADNVYFELIHEDQLSAMCHAINSHDKLVKQVAELRAALLSIKNHQQVLTPSGFEFSSVWQVANKALKESG